MGHPTEVERRWMAASPARAWDEHDTEGGSGSILPEQPSNRSIPFSHSPDRVGVTAVSSFPARKAQPQIRGSALMDIFAPRSPSRRVGSLVERLFPLYSWAAKGRDGEKRCPKI